MVMDLVPTAVQIHCRFDPLPEGNDLEEIQSKFINHDSYKQEEKLYYLVQNYTVRNDMDIYIWKDMLQFSYQFKDKIK